MKSPRAVTLVLIANAQSVPQTRLRFEKMMIGIDPDESPAEWEDDYDDDDGDGSSYGSGWASSSSGAGSIKAGAAGAGTGGKGKEREKAGEMRGGEGASSEKGDAGRKRKA